ncbi:MAG: DUF1730 domain-containing protein, partial [Gammaproteobacteria bacterium]|nr:DUF1730 domain-containing protein [Gammaproteobacteria bacterium]
MNTIDFTALCANIKAWALDLGFAQIGVADCDTNNADERLQVWLDKKFHGTMQYMENNRELRKNPEKLVPETARIISVRMDYLVQDHQSIEILENKNKAYVSRYALGRDYHKVVRKKLRQLAEKINSVIPHQYRAFADSAPIFERQMAVKSGIGWIGKNT